MKEYSSNVKEEKNLQNPIEILSSVIRQSSENLKNPVIIYNGNNLEDIQNISKFRYRAGLVSISNDISFLNKSKLYYGFDTIRLEKIIGNEEFEYYVYFI